MKISSECVRGKLMLQIYFFLNIFICKKATLKWFTTIIKDIKKNSNKNLVEINKTFRTYIYMYNKTCLRKKRKVVKL